MYHTKIRGGGLGNAPPGKFLSDTDLEKLLVAIPLGMSVASLLT